MAPAPGSRRTTFLQLVMKSARSLLLIGGSANALFFLFHLFLGWQIHHLQIAPPLRALMAMLNGGGALFILFLAYVSLFRSGEVLTSRLGQAVLVLGTSLYLLRAAAEFIVPPAPGPAIYLTCAATGAVYLGALLRSRHPRPITG